jgi:hypothetical protein
MYMSSNTETLMSLVPIKTTFELNVSVRSINLRKQRYISILSCFQGEYKGCKWAEMKHLSLGYLKDDGRGILKSILKAKSEWQNEVTQLYNANTFKTVCKN